MSKIGETIRDAEASATITYFYENGEVCGRMNNVSVEDDSTAEVIAQKYMSQLPSIDKAVITGGFVRDGWGKHVSRATEWQKRN